MRRPLFLLGPCPADPMADREHHGIHAMTIEGTPGHGDTFYRCTQCDVQAEREYHWLREKSSESVQK